MEMLKNVGYLAAKIVRAKERAKIGNTQIAGNFIKK